MNFSCPESIKIVEKRWIWSVDHYLPLRLWWSSKYAEHIWSCILVICLVIFLVWNNMIASTKPLLIVVSDNISKNIKGLVKCTSSSISNTFLWCMIVQCRGTLNRLLSSLKRSYFIIEKHIETEENRSVDKMYDIVTSSWNQQFCNYSVA